MALADAEPANRRLRRGRFGTRSALPLAEGGAGRFLPVLVGVMVLLLAVALEGALGLARSVDRWEHSLVDRATVQIPDPALPAMAGQLDKTTTRQAAVLAVLAAEPGIVAARALSDAEEARLLSPWLGPDIAIAELPVPRLVDLRLRRAGPGGGGPDEAGPDLAGLGERLAAAAPGTVLDDHAASVAGIVRLADKAMLAMAALALAVTLMTVLMVVFTSRTGLLIHGGIIGLLHLIGARDRDVARHFQWYAFRLSLAGGIGGAVVAALALLALANGRLIAERALGVPALAALLPAPSVDLVAWGLIAALPLATALVAALAARVTVLRMLGQLDRDDGGSSFYARGAIK